MLFLGFDDDLLNKTTPKEESKTNNTRTKKKKSQPKSSVSAPAASSKITNDILDDVGVQTPIEIISETDPDIVKILLSEFTDKNFAQIRECFFKENANKKIKDKKDEYGIDISDQKNVIIFDNEYFDKEDHFDDTGLYGEKVYSPILFNFIKDYLLLVVGIINKNKLESKLILQGGICTQNYSNGIRKTYDLDYIMIIEPKEKETENAYKQIEKELLPYFSTDIINIEKILKRLVIISEEVKEGKLRIKGVIDFFRKSCEFKFGYSYDKERNIIKVFVNAVNTTDKKDYKINIIDIKIYNKSPSIVIDILYKKGKKGKEETLLPDTIKNNCTLTNVAFRMIEKNFFMEQLKLYIEDSESEKPKYITPVKDIDFEKTKIFLKNKAERQLDAIKRYDNQYLEKSDGKKRKSHMNSVKKYRKKSILKKSRKKSRKVRKLLS